MTPDILLARIAAVEAVARAATAGPWESCIEDAQGDMPPDYAIWMPEVGHDGALVEVEADAAHIAAWDPARVLAVCAGAKTLVELHTPADNITRSFCAWCQTDAPCPSLAAVAAMFAEPGEES